MPEQQVMSYLTGLAGLAAIWLIVLIATKKHPWALAIGEDGAPSTSKFQMLVWTAAVVFAFLAIYQIRFSNGYRQGLPGLPTNLLVAMGISVATAVSAKSIAVNAQANNDAKAIAPFAGLAGPAVAADGPGLVPAVAPVAPVAAGAGDNVPPVGAVVASPVTVPTNKSGIFADDSGLPDLGKVQLVLWTLIAVGVFLSEVFALIQNPNCPRFDPKASSSACNLGLPDIGQTLMILMGLGNGAYIGKKIAES
jgi:hypothetical protein